jgi:transposase-like protein
MGKRGKAPEFVEVFCPNPKCPLSGQTGRGNIVGNGTYECQSGRVRKFICRRCGRVFNDRTGTFFFDLRSSEERVLLALKLLFKGIGIGAIAEVLDSKPDTVLSWLRRAAEHGAEVEARWLGTLKVSKVELDELWTFVEKKQLRLWKKRRASSGCG